MKKVFVMGSVSYDTIIYLSSMPEIKSGTIFAKSSRKTIGGSAAGKALNLAKLGFEVTLHTFLGNDEEGEKIKKYFSDKNINFIYDIDKQSTLSHTNLMDENGGRISIFTSYNEFEPDTDYDKFIPYIESCDYFILNIMNYARYLIPYAKKSNKKIWCDIHDYDGKNPYHNDFISASDYLFMSSDKMKEYNHFSEKMLKSGKKFVACTHGKEGATLFYKDKTYHEEIIKDYERIDTNGAGDAFFSGFLYAFDHGYKLEESLKFGTICGGLSVTSEELYYKLLTSDLIESEYNKYYPGEL